MKFDDFIEIIKKPIRPVLSWVFPFVYLYGWLKGFSKERMEMLQPVVTLIISFWFTERIIHKHGIGIIEKILQFFSKRSK